MINEKEAYEDEIDLMELLLLLKKKYKNYYKYFYNYSNP